MNESCADTRSVEKSSTLSHNNNNNDDEYFQEYIVYSEGVKKIFEMEAEEIVNNLRVSESFDRYRSRITKCIDNWLFYIGHHSKNNNEEVLKIFPEKLNAFIQDIYAELNNFIDLYRDFVLRILNSRNEYESLDVYNEISYEILVRNVEFLFDMKKIECNFNDRGMSKSDINDINNVYTHITSSIRAIFNGILKMELDSGICMKFIEKFDNYYYGDDSFVSYMVFLILSLLNSKNGDDTTSIHNANEDNISQTSEYGLATFQSLKSSRVIVQNSILLDLIFDIIDLQVKYIDELYVKALEPILDSQICNCFMLIERIIYVTSEKLVKMNERHYLERYFGTLKQIVADNRLFKYISYKSIIKLYNYSNYYEIEGLIDEVESIIPVYVGEEFVKLKQYYEEERNICSAFLDDTENPLNEDRYELFKGHIREKRDEILNVTNNLIPCLVEADESFFKHVPKEIQIQGNKFNDYLQYFLKLTSPHIKVLNSYAEKIKEMCIEKYMGTDKISTISGSSGVPYSFIHQYEDMQSNYKKMYYNLIMLSVCDSTQDVILAKKTIITDYFRGDDLSRILVRKRVNNDQIQDEKLKVIKKDITSTKQLITNNRKNLNMILKSAAICSDIETVELINSREEKFSGIYDYDISDYVIQAFEFIVKQEYENHQSYLKNLKENILKVDNDLSEVVALIHEKHIWHCLKYKVLFKEFYVKQHNLKNYVFPEVSKLDKRIAMLLKSNKIEDAKKLDEKRKILKKKMEKRGLDEVQNEFYSELEKLDNKRKEEIDKVKAIYENSRKQKINELINAAEKNRENIRIRLGTTKEYFFKILTEIEGKTNTRDVKTRLKEIIDDILGTKDDLKIYIDDFNMKELHIT